ncbi:MAG: host attachment protein [Pseudobdellovibrionaceae bacterium]
MKTWIIVVNRSEARIFSYDNKPNSEIQFVRKLDNPKGRLKAQDINASKPGILSTPSIHGPRLEKAETPTQHVAQEFAKRVTEFLDVSLQRKDFDNVIVIAEPNFLGRLRNLFSQQLNSRVSREISKDLNLNIVTRNEIKQRLWPEIAAP